MVCITIFLFKSYSRTQMVNKTMQYFLTIYLYINDTLSGTLNTDRLLFTCIPLTSQPTLLIRMDGQAYP